MIFHTEWNPALIEALRRPFPPECHEEKRQGGSKITFVALHHYKRRLNELVGPHGWSSTVRMEPIGGRLVATVALTILGVTKENVGDEVEEPEVNERGNIKMVGVPATNSYAQAFKRACADFGLGLYLYDETARKAAMNPAAASATNDQYDRINALLDERDLDEATYKKTVQRVTGGLTADAARTAITWLESLPMKEKAA